MKIVQININQSKEWLHAILATRYVAFKTKKMNRLITQINTVLTIIFLTNISVYGQSFHREYQDSNPLSLDDSFDFETIISDKDNLNFNLLFDSETVQRTLNISEKYIKDEKLKNHVKDFILQGINPDVGKPWSLRFDLKDSLMISENLRLIDSLKIFPPNMIFAQSYFKNSAKNAEYELIIIEKNENLSKLINGSDIKEISKHYNKNGDATLVLTFDNSKIKVLRDLTSHCSENKSYLAIISGDKFYMYDLIDGVIMNGILRFE